MQNQTSSLSRKEPLKLFFFSGDMYFLFMVVLHDLGEFHLIISRAWPEDPLVGVL